MFSPNKGFISGKFLLEYNGKNWKLSENQPPFYIDHLFIDNKSKLWATNNTVTFEAAAMRFNGKSWQKIYHPLVNQITSLCFLENGDAWIGGDREIVYYSKSKSEHLNFPPNLSFIRTIYGPDRNNLWVNTGDNKLFFFNHGKWESVLNGTMIKFFLFDSPGHGFVLTDKEILEYRNSRWQKHSADSLLNHISKLTLTPGKTIWGIGNKGLVIRFVNGSWKKENVPASEDLQDIQMLSESEGWITGNNGLILHYTDTFISEAYQNVEFGFESRRVYSVGKDVDDEYGVAIDDINGDGLKDIFSVCIYEPSRLYINKPLDPKAGPKSGFYFSEEASQRGISGLTGSIADKDITEIYLGIGMADVDNDKDPDIYLCDLADKNKLLINDGNGYFRNVSNQRNRAVETTDRTNAAVFADVDNDGDLDLFITNEYASNRLYLNDGGGYFTDITKEAGLISEGGGMGACFGDIDNDGKSDLFVCCWGKQNLLYRNISSLSSGVKFENISSTAGVEGEPHSKSNGASFCDIDNDGDPDLFVTNRKSSNRLYLNNGKGIFTDITKSAIGLDSMMSYGASFADFNNDGWMDLYIANVGENQLYKNIKGEKFVRVTSDLGDLNKGYYTGTAAGDIDNDGDIDLYSACYTGASSILFINNLNNSNFLIINVEGTVSNRDAAGAKVWLYEHGHLNDINYLRGYREINCGCGYVSHNSREIHFGVKEDCLYDAVVYFPASSIKKQLNSLKPGQRIKVTEEEGYSAQMTLTQKYLQRFAANPEVHLEILKFTIVLLAIGLSIRKSNRKYQWSYRIQTLIYPGVAVLYVSVNIMLSQLQFFISVVIPISVIFMSLLLFHLVYERIVMIRTSKLEKQQTRDRIARDLHDDLASTISTSLIYTDAIKRSLNNPSAIRPDMIEKINKLLNDAAEAITDIVWTVSPKYDKLNDLVLRLNLLISEACQVSDICYEYCSEIPSDKSIDISSEFKRNVFLIFKEALNNSVKFSSARHISFKASINKEGLKLSLSDDGTGFNIKLNDPSAENNIELNCSARPLHGNGINNMLLRAKEINASLKIESSEGNGTKVLLIKKMT